MDLNHIQINSAHISIKFELWSEIYFLFEYG
jgi:hypothetical protein